MMFLFGIYNAAETLFKKKARFASIFQQILTFVSCVDGSNVTANSNQSRRRTTMVLLPAKKREICP